MPYTYYFKLNKVCKMAKESSRYGECIYTGYSQCNSNNVISAYKFFFFRVFVQKIKEEEQKAKEEIEIL
ncbi:hypothetical protein CI238_12936 [Colletotrichum incanum]|uniref:Uncharacterized protein n=1 Tax=Colletotrichum incanum TaxID=1573173 RepID=A0A166UZE6_COLIC|nr:hypothetical protein CI238_12936 [Colletotrichum incanum]